jgi:phosphatidylinositol alpha-1,6-mannosyltransferase
MRVLLVTRNFPPVVGGMERLLYNAYRTLTDRFDVALVGPSGCERFVVNTTPTVSISLSPLARFLFAAQWHALRVARRMRPTVVLSGSGITAPATLLAARHTGAKAACFVHGLDLVADSVLYRRLFLPAVVRFDRLIANSHNTARLASLAGANPERIALLHPGVSMPSSDTSIDTAFLDRLHIADRRILLSVGRLTPRKGLCEFIRYSLPKLVARQPSLLLLVVGDEPQGALKHTAGQRERILEATNSTGMNEHVVLTGKVDDETLTTAYAVADLFVFPVIELPGDVEGFGMVALEAAAHGLPTVAFSVGGIPDAVSSGATGHLVRPGDYDEFARAITNHLETQRRDAWRERCVAYAEQFAWTRYGERLGRILDEVSAS